MENVKKIKINDHYGHLLEDQLCTGLGNSLKGEVKIYDKLKDGNLKLLREKSNLVLYKGREWLAQRAANAVMSGWTNPTSYFINWIGVGTNGASAGDILTPLRPEPDDENLYAPIMLDSTAGDYVNLMNGADPYQVKKINGKTFLHDIVNQNRYLVCQFQGTILNTDGNGPNSLTYYDISEAGLYVGDDAGTDTSISIFARCTFSTIRKDSSRSLVFLWNIYF